MLKLNQVKCNIKDSTEAVFHKACTTYKINPKDVKDWEIVRQAIDARKKPDIFYTYSLTVSLKDASLEKKIAKRYDEAHVSIDSTRPYRFPKSGEEQLTKKPIIVGMGPAGLFCGYYLAKHGYAPIILERGKKVEDRTRDVEAFWKNGKLLTESNVQFGEGGAGTFSDGKLNTLVKDKYGRNKEVLRTLVAFGAPKEIVYQAKPHIGTDVLVDVVRGMREAILSAGGEIRFETKMEELLIEAGRVTGVRLANGEILESNQVILATGHSARDTFEMLHQKKVPMEAKPFAVGFRTIHPQKVIDHSQYGQEPPKELGAAAYKVTAQTSVGRGVYSFCMCPGGFVVNASSEEGQTAVNGMSYSGRDGEYANSAIVFTVSPADYPGEGPLSGVAFQREIERKAYLCGKGLVPIQTYGAFKRIVEKEETGDISEPVIKELSYEEARKIGVLGTAVFTNLTGIFTKEMNQAFVEGMEHFGRQIHGFNEPDVLLAGVESRTSSPVKIMREEDSLECSVSGLYPCGEGAGYAGGITSAAMDGLKIAEKIRERYAPIILS